MALPCTSTHVNTVKFCLREQNLLVVVPGSNAMITIHQGNSLETEEGLDKLQTFGFHFWNHP
jgi:hypothetical protein